MSRYSEFDEEPSINHSTIQEDTQQLICVKALLSEANPIMDKIQFSPYTPKNYYPTIMSNLPLILNTQEYHFDSNNMILMEQAMFAHEKMKKDIAKCWVNKKTIPRKQMLTLRQFYAGKSLIYQKLPSSTTKGNYFATFTLNMRGRVQDSKQSSNKQKFMIRSTRTPSLSDRSKTQRLSLLCKSQIQFNSNFQSGNLFKVYQREYNQYDLILQNDINTKGNNQWFFFSVRNIPKNTNVKFNIVNMVKRYSLFQYGMKPAVFSMARFQRRNVGWVRDGTKLNYKESTQIRKQTSQQPFYCLSFQYKFQYDGDVVYFSYSIPYTFSNLCNFLSTTLADRAHHKKVRVRSLGETLGGNAVTLFEMTNTQSRVNKKSIWIMGRQHSGQVSSSFMMQGVFNFLLSGSEQANYLMDRYVFRVVPMLNIDGVVHGNSRADLSGHDPNRKWFDPSKIYQPVLFNIKKIIEKDNVEMIIDLHSHSRKLGTFFYCNQSAESSTQIKVFPMMVCKKDERFDYRSNRYRGGNNLTARKVFYDILNIPYIYTIESSLFGYQKQTDFRIIPYQPKDYREMASTVLNVFASIKISQDQLCKKDHRLLLCCQQQLQGEGEDNLWQKMNQVDQLQSMGSDEDPAGDQLSKKELDLIFQRKVKKSGIGKKKKEEPKIRLKKKVESIKKKQNKGKQSQRQSYKRVVSGRMMQQPRGVTTALDFYKRSKPQSKNFCCQVEIHQKAILHRSSLNSQISRDKSVDKVFDRRSLCVVGQKVDDEVVIYGNTVGIQTEVEKNMFKPRSEIMVENKSLPKKLLKSTPKVPTIFLHNQNNFLNRGDILHKAMRMLNNR